jgi:hypothetical protein
VHCDRESDLIEVDTTTLQEKIRRSLRLFSVAETQAYALATYFLTVIKARTPKKTGETRDSWTIHYHKVTDAIVWEISPDGKEKEVTYLEFGTKPHIIYPAHSTFKMAHGVLVFEKDGEKIFAMTVYHPGTKPLGFVRLTQDDLDKSAKEIAEKLLTNIRHIWD